MLTALMSEWQEAVETHSAIDHADDGISIQSAAEFLAPVQALVFFDDRNMVASGIHAVQSLHTAQTRAAGFDTTVGW